MKMIKNLFLFILLLFFFTNCSTIKDGFQSQRKNSTDEFLVEKKKPLVFPPDYNQLPIPTQENNENINNKEIEKLVKKKENISNSVEKNKNKTTEIFILEKIKQN